MTTDTDPIEPSWHAMFTADDYGADARTDWPTWADPRQQALWNTHGLVVWDDDSHILIGLRYHQAHTLLDFLRITSDWRTSGLRIGNVTFAAIPTGADDPPPPVRTIPEPVFATFHGRRNRNVRPVLSDLMDITPTQAQHLLTLLEAHTFELHIVEHAFWEQASGATAPLFPEIVQDVRNPRPSKQDIAFETDIEQRVRDMQRARAQTRYSRE